MNKEKLRDIVEGSLFTAVIQFLILASAIVFVLESDRDVWGLAGYATHFIVLDWVFFVLFSQNMCCGSTLNPENGISFSVFTA